MENLIIYDWVSITSKIHSVVDFIELIGFQNVPWQDSTGSKGFKHRLYYDCVSIHYGGRDEGWIWLEMSGQGCRAFESYGTGDYDSLFQLVEDNPGDMNITRLDVAFDDHTGCLDIVTLCNDTCNLSFVSKFKHWEVRQGSKGRTVTHGSEKSDFYIRIYDKSAERGITDGTHWIRVELQINKKRALQFILSSGDIGTRFSGVLSNYLRYIEPDELDTNKWRWPLKDYWFDLLEGANKLSLYVKPGTDYNMARMTNYVFKQAGNAIDATIQVLGIETFMDELRTRGTVPNPKYQQIIDKANTPVAERGNHAGC